MRHSSTADKVKVQTMMALMFFVQLGCCDGRATARHEDLVPEQKISAINFQTVVLLM